MKKLSLALICIGFALAAGFWAYAPPLQAEAPQPSSKTVEKEKMNSPLPFHAARYTVPSTEGSIILIQVRLQGSDKVDTVAIDNTYWLERVGVYPYKYTTADHRRYVEYMLAHESQPFDLTPEQYRKVKSSIVPPLDPQLLKLSPEEIQERYLEHIPHSDAWTRKPDDRQLSRLDFVHLILAKGCILRRSCLDGSYLVYFPPQK